MSGRYSTPDRRSLRYMNPVSDRLRLDNYLDTILGGLTQIGEIFYVDSVDGLKTNDGKSPDKAKKTSQQGIDLCVADRGDVVIKRRGGEAVTSTVDFDCQGMTFIAENFGGNPLAMGEYNSIYSTTLTSAPTAIVTADGVTIAGIGFVGVDATATFYGGAALLLRGSLTGTADAAPFGARIVDCRFPKWNLANRIGIGIDGSSDSIIEHCCFEGVGADFASGIYVQGATQNIEISNNRFRDCTYGIVFGAFTSGPHCVIKSNVFEDAKILSAPSAAHGIICDNWSELAVGTASFNVNYAALAALGLYCSDNHYAETD